MPPYKPYASKAQQRLLHSKAERGKISQGEIKGKDKATNFSHLPEHVEGKKKKKGRKRSPATRISLLQNASSLWKNVAICRRLWTDNFSRALCT